MTDDDKRQYHALRGKELTAYLTAFGNASYAGKPVVQITTGYRWIWPSMHRQVFSTKANSTIQTRYLLDICAGPWIIHVWSRIFTRRRVPRKAMP